MLIILIILSVATISWESGGLLNEMKGMWYVEQSNVFQEYKYIGGIL